MKTSILVLFLTTTFSFFVAAQSIEPIFDEFDGLYQAELGSTQGCVNPEVNVFRVCSSALRNDKNAPYILHHGAKTEKVMVLFHGLSDSPFYFRSIAKAVYQEGFNVVVALLPGHGKIDPDADMEDSELADRWRSHIAKVTAISEQLGDKIYLGGFSTGGALATEYILQHPEKVSGLTLFSGALALDPNVEFMANIWGIQLLAKFLDGDYQSENANPYKYPQVARFAAFELVEVIFSVRELLEKGAKVDLPIFAAHSTADRTTPIVGVKSLMEYNQATSVLYELPKELEICHADVVINEEQVSEIGIDGSLLEEIMPCDVPKANPKHAEMLTNLMAFLAAN
ncbi:alpha/beta hydrolase [Paraglaciecola sp. 2405UD69-4]|uniref:alpha/beta hydrolase n=1 Tax=Paraglaciecola sp. 2405UD69-4 TaxID=3391836 RepID=UPI0039C9904E